MRHRHVKQPAEIVTLAVDFGPLLAPGETLASAGVTAETEALTVALLPEGSAVSGSRVQARVAGGVDGSQHKLTFLATTSAGHRYEEEVALWIREL